MTRWRRARRAGRILALAARMAVELVALERRRGRLDREEFETLQERLLRRQAVRLRETALELEGLLIKLGQFLSTRVDVLPAAFTEELAGLRDAVPAVPWDAVERQLRAELPAPLEEVFASLERQAIAAASLGQVHRGELRSGPTVAVKVQRPGIEELIDVDLVAVRRVVLFARRWTDWEKRVDLLALFGELERTTREELDYVQEAEHARRFAANFAGQDDVVVPGVFAEWTSRRVLVMEYAGGTPVDDRPALVAAGQEPRAVADRLVRTYLQQVLRDGFFHADPHPGNVFVDASGALVYVDFGMMGEVPEAQRASFGRLVGAVIGRDYDALVEAIRDLGVLRPHADAATLKKGLALALDHLSGVPLERPASEEFQEFLEEMRAFLHSEPFQLPTEFAFLGRAVGILLGLTTSLDPQIDFVGLLRDNALPYLHLDGDRAGFTAELAWREVRDMALLLYRLPRRLDRLLAKAESGELRVRVDLSSLARRLDERNRLLAGLQRTLLAIAGGLIAAWLSVGGLAADARAAWAATALLLLWAARGGARRR